MSNLAKIYIAFDMNMFWVNYWLVLQIVNEIFLSISWILIVLNDNGN